MGFQEKSIRTAAVATAALLGTTVVAGQGQMPFRAAIDFVSTEVIARQDGKFVPDLEEDEFLVYEDDVLQTVTLFEPYIGGRSLGNLAAATPTRRPRVREGLILPTQRRTADASGRLFVVFIDDLHFPPSATPQVKDLLRHVRDTLVHDNDLVGFVSSGYSSIAIEPAYDYEHRRFNEAIEKTMGSAMSADEIVEGALLEGMNGPQAMRYNAQVAFKTAAQLLQQMGDIPDRRKAFIYVSNGYNFNPFAGERWERVKAAYENQDITSGLINPEDDSEEMEDLSNELEYQREQDFNKRTQFTFSELTRQVADLAWEAQRSNVTFYTIDPRGLIASGNTADTRAQISFADWRDYFTTQISTLKVLAEETGGFCICETNDFEGGLERIDAETSDFYRIGYSSSNPDPTDVRREIRIEVTRPGVEELTYRREYTLERSED